MDMKGSFVTAVIVCIVTSVAAQSGLHSFPVERNESTSKAVALSHLEDDLVSKLESGELFEGDLKISGEIICQLYDFSSMPSNETSSCSSTVSMSAIHKETQNNYVYQKLWPKGVIHYSIDPSVSVSLAYVVREALDEWEEATVLHFVSKDPETTDGLSANFVNFTAISGGGCYSDSVGMKGGQQVVNLANSECQTCGKIMHLIGHVVGLWHEQSRPDRDDYLHVMSENIEVRRRQDFMKLKESSKEYNASDLLYDYGSIMHYPLTAFSKCENGTSMCLTLVIRNLKEYMEQGYPALGQRENLGNGDVQKIAHFYNSTKGWEYPASAKKGRILVHVDRGYNLPFTGDTPDSYVKITAEATGLNNKTIEAVIHMTAVRHDHHHPVWNELLDLGGREWMPFFRIEAWDSDTGADAPISIPEVIMIDRIHMERTHCINPSCQGYIRYTYSFTEDGDECLPNPCQNGGNCIDGISSYTCSCPPVWTGTNCHIRLACYDEPCQNGGTCNEHTNYDTGTSTYTCSCPSDWIGSNCQSRLACYSQPCQNGGTCINHITD